MKQGHGGLNQVKHNKWMRLTVQFGLMLALLFSLVGPVPASGVLAAGTTVASIEDKYQGETVTISGTANADDVIVKVFDPTDSVYFFRSIPVVGQHFQTNFTLAQEAELGRYTVLVGMETEIARTNFLVLKKDSDETIDKQLEDALADLSIGFRNGDTWESVTSNFFMLSTGKHDTQVAWTSSKPDVIVIGKAEGNKIEGEVRRQDEEQSIVVTATVSKQNRALSRPFLLIVKDKGSSKASVTENTRTVKVVGEHGGFSNLVGITRIVMSDRTSIDKAILNEDAANKIVDSSKKTGERVARLLMDTLPHDIPDELAVELTAKSLLLLAHNGLSFQLESDTAFVTIDNRVLQQMKKQVMDLYFRIVPVRSAEKRKLIEKQILQEPLVKKEAGNRQISMVGTPQKIETNYKGYSTALLIPFNGILPQTNQSSYLKGLRVFIEHSDGQKQLVTGKVVSRNGVPFGLEITIDKFSTFTLVQIEQESGSTGGGGTGGSSGGGGGSSAITTPAPTVLVTKGEHHAYVFGYPNDTFQPEKQIKRSEMAALLARLYEGNLGPSSASHSDLTDAHWAYKDIMKVGQAGLMKGMPNGTFQPDRMITRAEMASIVSVWLNLPAASAKSMPDTKGHWAKQAIEKVVAAGLMTGYPDGSFKPDRGLTRAETVSILNRLQKRGPLTGVTTPTWTDVPMTHWAFGQIEEASTDHRYEKSTNGIEKKSE